MLFGLFRRSSVPTSAETAKDRLQILLTHERQDRSRPDYLPLLQRDILEAIRKYAQVASDKVEVRFLRGESISTIEIGIQIQLPGSRTPNPKSAAAFAT